MFGEEAFLSGLRHLNKLGFLHQCNERMIGRRENYKTSTKDLLARFINYELIWRENLMECFDDKDFKIQHLILSESVPKGPNVRYIYGDNTRTNSIKEWYKEGLIFTEQDAQLRKYYRENGILIMDLFPYHVSVPKTSLYQEMIKVSLNYMDDKLKQVQFLFNNRFTDEFYYTVIYAGVWRQLRKYLQGETYSRPNRLLGHGLNGFNHIFYPNAKRFFKLEDKIANYMKTINPAHALHFIWGTHDIVGRDY